MFAAAAAAILVALALAITRAIKGPTVFDRVLAGNSVGTLAIMLLAVVGFLTGRPEFLDIGLTYGLLNLIGTLAVLKFFRHGDLAYEAEEEPKIMTLVRRNRELGADPPRIVLHACGRLRAGAHAGGLHPHARGERHRHARRRLSDPRHVLQAGFGLVTLKLVFLARAVLLHRPGRDACARAGVPA